MQVVYVVKYVGQWNYCGDDSYNVLVFCVGDLVVVGVEVIDDVIYVVFGSDNFNFYDWFEQFWIGFLNGFVEVGMVGDFEGQDGGVNVVVGIIGQGCFDVEYWEVGQWVR